MQNASLADDRHQHGGPDRAAESRAGFKRAFREYLRQPVGSKTATWVGGALLTRVPSGEEVLKGLGD